MFINLSNHISSKWSEKQYKEAGKWGEVRDILFPGVPAEATSEEIVKTAEDTVKEVLTLRPDCVMCQGEFTLTFHIVSMLKKEGIKVVAACSERNVEEHIREDGSVEKAAVYNFVQFREY